MWPVAIRFHGEDDATPGRDQRLRKNMVVQHAAGRNHRLVPGTRRAKNEIAVGVILRHVLAITQDDVAFDGLGQRGCRFDDIQETGVKQ